MKLTFFLYNYCTSVFMSITIRRLVCYFKGCRSTFGLPYKKDAKKSTITVDSPKQQAFDMPAEIVIAADQTIKVEMTNLGVTFEGIYYNDSISGTFKQGPIVEAMIFYREKTKPKKAKRPQNPKAPYSYIQEEVKFKNLQDSFSLAGTLTLPKNKTNLPAIVLVSGSGPQNRDEEMMGHRPFGCSRIIYQIKAMLF